jgi:hypothetical protein
MVNRRTTMVYDTTQCEQHEFFWKMKRAQVCFSFPVGLFNVADSATYVTDEGQNSYD